MPSSYTARTSQILQAAGENLNVWGDPNLNNNFRKVDFAVKGRVGFSLSGSRTLTSSTTSPDEADIQSIAAYIHVTSGTGGTIIVPSRQGMWFMRNDASGDVTVTTGSGRTSTIAPGDAITITCDGTHVDREVNRDFGGGRGTSLGEPLNPQDAATKAYADGLVFAATLPGQAGQNGKFLQTNGATASWQTVFPSFSGTSGYFLTSNGASGVWSSPSAARTALGLGPAALLSVGTVGGTVAAGNDPRITAAMPKTGGGFTGDVTGVNLTLSGINTAQRGRFTNVSNPSLSGTAHALQTGLDGSDNIAFGDRGIQARSNGAASDLDLNPLGGGVLINTFTAYHEGNIPAFALLSSPAFSGNPTVPTQTAGNNSTRIASTAFVTTAVSTAVSSGTSGLAPIASPTFTGTPAAPTPATATNTTQLATTAYVKANLANYAPITSPVLAGTPTAPTATNGSSTTQIATTAFVTDSPTFTGTPSIGSDKLMRVATGTAANSGRVSFGTAAPGTLALGEIYLQHA